MWSSVKVGRVTDVMSRGGRSRQTKQLHDSLVYHLLCPSPGFSVLILFCTSSDGKKKQDVLTNLAPGRRYVTVLQQLQVGENVLWTVIAAADELSLSAFIHLHLPSVDVQTNTQPWSSGFQRGTGQLKHRPPGTIWTQPVAISAMLNARPDCHYPTSATRTSCSGNQ